MALLKKIGKILLAILAALLLTVIIAVGLDSYGTRYLNTAKLKEAYLITNVNVIPMDRDTVLPGKMVYLRDGKIQSIDDEIQADGVEVIDGENHYLMPGLIDMHVHVWDRYELGLYLSNGVTAIRNLWGMPMHLRIKEDANEERILSPMFFTTGPKLTGPEFIGDDNLQLTSPGQAKAKVIEYKERGYDFIKTYYGLTPELFDAVLEQARLSAMDVVAHPSPKVSYNYHFDPQIKSIEHAEEIIQQPLNYVLDSVKLKEVVEEFSRSENGFFSPTLIVYYNIYQMLIQDDILDSEKLDVMNPLIRMVDSKAQFDRWHGAKLADDNIVNTIKAQHDFHLKIVKDLHEAGVTIVCGTDSGIGVTSPGQSIHQELAFYKEAGLSNYEVLKTATVNASKTHSIMHEMGSIETGKLANLLLLEKNPLSDLSALKNPSAVFIKGRRLNRETLDAFDEKAKNRKNLIVSALRYGENLVIEK